MFENVMKKVLKTAGVNRGTHLIDAYEIKNKTLINIRIIVFYLIKNYKQTIYLPDEYAVIIQLTLGRPKDYTSVTTSKWRLSYLSNRPLKLKRKYFSNTFTLAMLIITISCEPDKLNV